MSIFIKTAQGDNRWLHLRGCFITGSSFSVWQGKKTVKAYKEAVLEKKRHWQPTLWKIEGAPGHHPLDVMRMTNLLGKKVAPHDENTFQDIKVFADLYDWGATDFPDPKPEPSEGLRRTMEWGSKCEDVARAFYQGIMGYQRIESSCGMVIDGDGMIAASPDGYVLNDQGERLGVLEIKCPAGAVFFRTEDRANFNPSVPEHFRSLLSSGSKINFSPPEKYGTDDAEPVDEAFIGQRGGRRPKEFRMGGKLEAHYLQVLGNMFISDVAWADYFVYLPPRDSGGHNWYNGTHYRRFRVYKTDQWAVDDWEAAKRRLHNAYTEEQQTFTRNNLKYLKWIAELEDGDPNKRQRT
jgi:hypothetical protein